MLPMPDTQTKNSATQLVSSIKHKLSHAIIELVVVVVLVVFVVLVVMMTLLSK